MKLMIMHHRFMDDIILHDVTTTIKPPRQDQPLCVGESLRLVCFRRQRVAANRRPVRRAIELARVTVTAVDHLHLEITESGRPLFRLNGIRFARRVGDQIARSSGCKDFDELQDFIREQYGLPFNGKLYTFQYRH